MPSKAKVKEQEVLEARERVKHSAMRITKAQLRTIAWYFVLGNTDADETQIELRDGREDGLATGDIIATSKGKRVIMDEKGRSAVVSA